MIRYIDVLKRYGFLKDILTLATGGVLAQVIGFAVSPVLARIYSPQEFGVFSIYAFIVAVPAAVVCWCYEAAVLVPKEDEEGRNVVVLSIVIASAMAIVMVVPSVFGGSIVRMLNAPALAPWLGFVSFNLLALGVYQALSYWCNRTGDFDRLAVSRVVQSGFTAGSQVAAGVVAAGPGGLLMGQVVGQVVASGFLWRHAVRRGGLDGKEVLRSSMLLRTLKRYRRFPLYTSWGTLASVAAFQVVPVLLSGQFGPVEAGFYFFGYRLMSSGVVLGTSSIGQVFYQRTAANVHQRKSVAPLVEAVVARLAVVAGVAFGVFVVFAPEIFSFIFGSNWAVTGGYMRIVAPVFFLQLITAPVSMVLFLFEKQHVAAITQLSLLAGTLGSFGLSKMLDATLPATLGIYASVQCVTYLVYLTIILRLSSVSPFGVLRAIASGRWIIR